MKKEEVLREWRATCFSKALQLHHLNRGLHNIKVKDVIETAKEIEKYITPTAGRNRAY